jgi:hypothetical protein
MHYTTLILTGAAIIKTSGFNIFCNTLLDIQSAGAGAIQNNGTAGNVASGATGGALVSSSTARPHLAIQLPSGAGATGTTATGSAGSADSPPLFVSGGQAGAAAAGGTSGTAVAGSAAGTLNNSNPVTFQQTVPKIGGWSVQSGNAMFAIGPSVAGPGGGAGGGDGTNAGGGGGGGALGAGMVAIYARQIQRGANIATAIVQAVGATGGAGAAGVAGTAGGGGGGGGAGGGFVYIVADGLLGSAIANAIDVSGGTGGAGGNGSGTGKGGGGGGGGNGGNYQILNLGAPAFTVGTFNATGGAGTTTATATGAAGGAGAIVRGAL